LGLYGVKSCGIFGFIMHKFDGHREFPQRSDFFSALVPMIIGVIIMMVGISYRRA